MKGGASMKTKKKQIKITVKKTKKIPLIAEEGVIAVVVLIVKEDKTPVIRGWKNFHPLYFFYFNLILITV